jgi:predicted nucleic acid-binding protein
LIFLLDVNALLAMGYSAHVHHARVMSWLRGENAAVGSPAVVASCAITELGFVRIASGPAALADNVHAAQSELQVLKREHGVVFFADEVTADNLPAWVTKPKQTTDGHLLQLATSHRARFATLDRWIPGADLIPEHTGAPLMVREPYIAYNARQVMPYASPMAKGLQ